MAQDPNISDSEDDANVIKKSSTGVHKLFDIGFGKLHLKWLWVSTIKNLILVYSTTCKLSLIDLLLIL